MVYSYPKQDMASLGKENYCGIKPICNEKHLSTFFIKKCFSMQKIHQVLHDCMLHSAVKTVPKYTVQGPPYIFIFWPAKVFFSKCV